MNTENISRIKMMIADQMGVEIGAVTDDATLDGLGCDSLDYVEIIMYAEDMFDIVIPDDVVPRQSGMTVGDFIALVDARIAAENPNG